MFQAFSDFFEVVSQHFQELVSSISELSRDI